MIANAPEGVDALLLGRLAADRAPQPVLHVARDDARLARLVQSLAFFAPGAQILTLPAWDCLPYDRVSPHRDMVARRIDALTRLLDPAPAAEGGIVITTVNALIQRVPPCSTCAGCQPREPTSAPPVEPCASPGGIRRRASIKERR